VLRDCLTCRGASGCTPERSRIAIKDKGRIILIEATELISAEARGNYVLLQKKAGSYLLRETMAGIAEKLKPYGFIRIHRSVLVNRAFVNTIQCGSGGNYILQTSSGKEPIATISGGWLSFGSAPRASASTDSSPAPSHRANGYPTQPMG
jgi:DNA-binding LytR/AlgR family response regulator